MLDCPDSLLSISIYNPGETPDACDAYKKAAKLAKSASLKSDYEKRAEDLLDKVTKTAQAIVDRAIRTSKDMERPRDKYLRLIQEGHHFPLDSAAVRNVNCIDNVLQGWKVIQARLKSPVSLM